MDCREFRFEVGADPGHLGADAMAHRNSCPACAEMLRRTLELDARIVAALSVPVPERGRSEPWRMSAEAAHDDDAPRVRVLRFPIIERRRWIALAASIAGGVIVGSLLWVGGPRASLAEDVVHHMGHEPEAMAVTIGADPAEVARVLERAGVALKPGIGVVSYANTCPFRGEKVPHLVVQTVAGPVTVMVLRHEKVERPVNFNEDGYAGTIVPAGPGSIAVIGRAPMADLDEIAAQVNTAVEWVPRT